MKLTHNTKRAKGMTLLELTVVILVLLSLISILFIGARAWKKGSDRSANILNVRNVQQAARGHANMNGLAEGTAAGAADGGALASGTLFPTYMAAPTVPSGAVTAGGANAYTFLANVPAIGELYVSNADLGLAASEYFYAAAASYDDW